MKTLILSAVVLLLTFIITARGGVDASRFQILEFNGHSYVAYDGNSYDSGLLHDPDCHCRKSNLTPN